MTDSQRPEVPAASPSAAPDYRPPPLLASVPPRIARPEQALPSVQPPTAGFLVQLFLIPLIIVSAVVMVWLGLHWLAQMGSRPVDMIAQLESFEGKRHDHAWQIANDLAVMLSGRQSAAYRRDPQLAQPLARILVRECERSDSQENRVELQIYLCTALGQFEIPDGLPALTMAAEASQPPAVRAAALEAITMLGDDSRLGPETLRQDADVQRVIQSAAEAYAGQPDQEIAQGTLRSRAAYAWGVIGGKAAQDGLVDLLGDPFPDARYNAAAGLAAQGNTLAIPQLVEMLQIDNPEAIRFEAEPAQPWKREIVWEIGLKAVEALLDKARPAEVDRQALLEAVERLHDTGDLSLQLQLKPVRKRLQRAPQLTPSPPG